jgi:hypothetical protein
VEAAFLPFLASCSAVRAACLGLAVSVAFVELWPKKCDCQRNLAWSMRHSSTASHAFIRSNNKMHDVSLCLRKLTGQEQTDHELTEWTTDDRRSLGCADVCHASVTIQCELHACLEQREQTVCFFSVLLLRSLFIGLPRLTFHKLTRLCKDTHSSRQSIDHDSCSMLSLALTFCFLVSL